MHVHRIEQSSSACDTSDKHHQCCRNCKNLFPRFIHDNFNSFYNVLVSLVRCGEGHPAFLLYLRKNALVSVAVERLAALRERRKELVVCLLEQFKNIIFHHSCHSLSSSPTSDSFSLSFFIARLALLRTAADFICNFSPIC